MENFENSENVEIVEDLENFPVKDRSKAAIRRKKTYFKGKNRLDRICKTRQYATSDRFDSTVKGMLKKTNVVTPHFDPDPYVSVNLKSIRRDLGTKEMLKDYYEEAV